MYEIARRAGVGQGTLYRHFPARSDLAAALFERINDELAATADQHAGEPDLLDRLLRTVVANQARLHSLSMGLWSTGSDPAAVDHLLGRTRTLFAAPLRVAQEAGRVRADLGVDDMIAVTAMIEGVLTGIRDPAERDAAAARALDLVWAGLLPR
jgi:AcrR family transcriptional regulator